MEPGFTVLSEEDQKPRNERGSSVSLSSKRKYSTVELTDDFKEKVVKYVKKNRPRTLTKEERLDILLLQVYFRAQEGTQKSGGLGATSIISKILRRNNSLVQKVWKEYIESGSISVAPTPFNPTPMTAKFRVPDARIVLQRVQEFMRIRRETRTRTVAKDVMVFLRGEGFISYDPQNKKETAATLRATQRFLLRKGFSHGTKKGLQHYHLKTANLIKRDDYVQRMMLENTRKERRIVYVDESYIHKDYCCQGGSLYDPNDEQDLKTTTTHEGERYCFIGAIVDADHSVPAEHRTAQHQADFLHDTLDIFEGGKKQTKDFHDMFSHSYFEAWMAKLLASLEKRQIQNAVIVMDTAKYHKNRPEGTPKANMTKSALLEACARYGMTIDPNLTKIQIWDRLQKHIDANVKPVVVTMANVAGHEVVYCPPHYSNLQPIELVWGIVKGEVGRQYTKQITFSKCLVRLKAAFQNLKPDIVQGCINVANKNLSELHRHIHALDDADDLIEDEDDYESDYASGCDMSVDAQSNPESE